MTGASASQDTIRQPQNAKRRLFRSWESRTALFLLAASVASVVATYGALRAVPPFGNNPETVIWLLNADLIILLLLVAVVARKISILWSGRKKKLAGSRLHVRLVYTFSLLAAAPVIIMTIASAVFFHFGVQTWFSERVKSAIDESSAVAEAYFNEHREVIKADILAMANDLDRESTFLMSDESAFERVMQTQSVLRNLTEAIVFDSTGRVLARSGLTFSLEFENVSNYALRRANDGDVVITTGANDDRIRALVKLNNFFDSYLYVGRMADPKVLSHLAAAREGTEDYADLRKRYSSLQVKVTMIYVVVGLILVLMAIWYGLILARQIVSPIGGLIAATEKVRQGDLTARATEQQALEEFDYLAGAFNRMTTQIQEQQNALLKANRQLDRRRQLIETVLTGVSSGVIGVDIKNKIHLANQSALDLLGIQEDKIVGASIENLLPEITALLKQAHARPLKTTHAEISFERKNGANRIFLFRVVIEMLGEKDLGAIVTFDDITELQSAQRKAAWADVARRIAHEIKNPLTPIQLSAESLKRKYLKYVGDDARTFSQYTDTIIKNVEDIGRMVNEFSSFARMPEPVMKERNIRRDIEEALFLHRQAHQDIGFNFKFADAGYVAYFDQQQVRQALNNLIQNAVDSIHMRAERENGDYKGRVDVLMAPYGADEIAIAVSDNGLGLPDGESPARLTEPYVTHKPKGTGLGLAIVKKIMEDHKGSLLIGAPDWLKSMKSWQDLGGATVALLFPSAFSKQKETKAA